MADGRKVSVTLTEEEHDVLVTLACLEGVRPPGRMLGVIVRERLAHSTARDAHVRELVAARRQRREELERGQRPLPRFQVIEGGKA